MKTMICHIYCNEILKNHIKSNIKAPIGALFIMTIFVFIIINYIRNIINKCL